MKMYVLLQSYLWNYVFILKKTPKNEIILIIKTSLTNQFYSMTIYFEKNIIFWFNIPLTFIYPLDFNWILLYVPDMSQEL